MECDSCDVSLEFSRTETVQPEKAYEEADVIGSASTKKNEYIFECSDCGQYKKRIKFFTLSLRPQGAEDIDKVLQFCREEKIIGIGWGLEGVDFETREDYLDYRCHQEPEIGEVKRSVKDFVIWNQPDDIVFLYDKPTSQYYLAQVTGEWQYITQADLPKEKREEYKKHDIWQFRKATWHEMPRKYLTGDVLSGTPPPSSTIHKKDFDEEQAKYLALLPEEPDVDNDAEIAALQDCLRQQAFGPDGSPEEILRPLTDDELETIVVSFVQRHTDAVLMQNTTNDDLPDVESLLRAVGDDGRPQTIGTQVKRGGLDNKGNLENFLTNADDLYIYGKGDSGIEGATDISNRDIAEYMSYYTAELPPSALLRLEGVYG